MLNYMYFPAKKKKNHIYTVSFPTSSEQSPQSFWEGVVLSKVPE